MRAALRNVLELHKALQINMITDAEKNFQLFFISLFPLCSQKPFNGPKVGEIVIGIFTKLSDWSLLRRF
jgi:hypothetical protein